MPSTNAKRRHLGQQGFSMIELMTAALVSLIVFAALFSAYIYIARNITRISLAHQQTLQSSRIQRLFANDVGAATRIISAHNGELQLQMQASVVTYTYNFAAQTLQRTDTTVGVPPVVLTGITPLPLAFSTPSLSSNVFNYYNQTGTPLLPAPSVFPPPDAFVVALFDIRQVELSFLSTDGVSSNGTMVQNPSISSRIILRNKPPLGQ